MQNKYIFIMENGIQATVEYEVTEDSREERAYGVAARLQTGGYEEYEAVRKLFFTKAEAQKVVKMLSKYGVTPCSLKDVLI